MNALVTRLKKFFGIDFNYFLKGGIWLGLDQTVSIILGLVLSVAFANLISKETYGNYRYLMSIFGILTIFTLPSMNLAVTTSVAKGYSGSLLKILFARIRWGLIGSVASAALSVYYLFFKGDPVLGFAFIVMTAFLPVSDSLNVYVGFLRGRKLFKLQTYYSVITRVASALVLIGALFLTDNLFLILLAFFLPYIFLRLIFFWRSYKTIPAGAQGDPKVISYGKHLSGIQLVNVLVNSLDNLLIFNFLGPVSLAVYNIALLPISKIQQFFSVFTELALPKFSEAAPGSVRKNLLRKVIKMSAIVILGIILYVAAAPVVFKIVFPKYPESIGYSLWLGLGLIGLPFGFIYTFLQSQALEKKIAQYNFSIRAVQILLTLTFIPLYGIAGAVIARVSFHVISAALVTFVFLRKNSDPKMASAV